MNPALWISKTGLEAQQMRMNTVANNLANSSTTGFKKGRAVFEDLLYQNIRQVGAQSSQDTQLPSGLSIGAGVRVVATEKLFGQGNLIVTDANLDLAVQGRGFLQVLLPDGTQAYTRDGSLKVDSNGVVVTSGGYQVQPSLTIPPQAQSVTIGADGVVSVLVAGQTAPSQVGQIQVADFMNVAGLQARGENLFLETAASGTPQVSNPGTNGTGTVIQGSLESSNVNVVEELVNMIETQRAYEMNSKAIDTTDKMLQFAVNNLG